MSRQVPGVPSALRRRGCVLQEDFFSSLTMAKNRWTLVGAPTVDKGITLDGATQYASRVLDGTEFDSDEISIVCEFYPDFDYDANLNYYLYDSAVAGAGRYTCYKRDNAAGNSLYVMLGDTLIVDIPSATYSPYWNVGERNAMVISGTTGVINAWLNGNQIITANATAWAPKAPTLLTLGVRHAFDAAGRFDGTINSFQVYNALLTAQEALDIYNNATFTYRNKATLDLQMRMVDHDPVNIRTLDSSGHGNHATFGDGVTPATFPTKLGTRGYSFDGGDYLELGTKTQPSGAFSVGIAASSSINAAAEFVAGHGNAGTPSNFLLANLAGVWSFYVGGTAGGNRSFSASPLAVGTPHTFVGVWDGTDTILYIDGVAEAVAVTPLAPGGGTYSMELGKRVDAPANYFTGDIFSFNYFDGQALTSTQALDIHMHMMAGVNNV